MLNSPTNLQAAILRGIDYREITTTTKLGEYMKEGKLEYLESPDVLPTISTAGSGIQRGAITIQNDEEDGELTDERIQQMTEAGARAAIAFTGAKHGSWMAEPDALYQLPAPDDELDDDSEEEKESQKAAEVQARPQIPDSNDGIDPELLALIGEDRWVDEDAESGRRLDPDSLDNLPSQRQPNAELVPQQTRSRQMKPLPGLGADDAGSRKLGAIILGLELKNNLTMFLGGELNVMSPSGDLGPTGGMAKSRPFKLVGSFYSGMFDFDAKMGYISLEDAQALLGIGDRISGIDVRCTRLEDSKEVRDALREKLKDYDNIRVDDWRTLNSSLFSAIMLEKVAMFTILTSIILVASFNILCLLIMMVIEKGREIAIFKAMGTTDRSIVRMFVIQGGVIGVLGTVIGLILGFLVCFFISWLKLKIPGNVHYIEQLPVNIQVLEILLICIAAVVISLLATILPSRMAVKLKAVDGLKCE